MDFENYDSHGHIEYMRIIDNKFWDKVIPILSQHLDLHPDLIHAAHRLMNNTDLNFLTYIPGHGKRFKFAKGTITGTVPSGSPHRTTLGNSMRTLLILKFLAHQAAVPATAIQYAVQGDDSIIFISKQYLH